MLVASVTTFSASRKEPLAVLLERIHTAFLTADLGEPATHFSLSDAPAYPGFTSSVDRVLKRYPELQRFFSDDSVMPGIPPVRRLSNRSTSAAPDGAVDFSTLLAIAGGVPRSFPFHNLSIHFQAPAFGAALSVVPTIGPSAPGVTVGDSWWSTGACGLSRRSPASTPIPAARKCPRCLSAWRRCSPHAERPKAPCRSRSARAPRPRHLAGSPAVARDRTRRQHRRPRLSISARRRHRSRGTPHDLPPAMEALTTIGLGETAGPKKPVLLRAFKPMGYDCRGGSGTFTLRRRTAGNLTVAIDVDVGTWSRSLTAGFSVTGLGFTARLPLPSRNAPSEAASIRLVMPGIGRSLSRTSPRSSPSSTAVCAGRRGRFGAFARVVLSRKAEYVVGNT